MSIISGIAGLTSSEVLNLIARNEEGGTAGIYDCKTLLNEHRPVCTKEYHLTGKYLDGGDNPDVWFPIPGAGGGTVVYSNRFLTVTSGTGEASASRCVIDQTKFPTTGNFVEVTCRIGAKSSGVGGTNRYISFGFQPAFSMYYGKDTDRATFSLYNGIWYITEKSQGYKLMDLPLGRELAPGDICTVRLDRREGSSNIDIVRFYVNGQKQHETLDIPAVDCYAGIGAFANADVTSPVSIAIDYFGVKYVP